VRIAQIAPLYESVPPAKYGGTERIVSYLTEELVRQGHQVTLFASGDSKTSATLVPCAKRSLRLHSKEDPIVKHFIQTEEVFRRAEEFDVMHFHTDFLHFPISSRIPSTHITTLHGRLDLPDLPCLYQFYPRTPLISISDSQRRPLPNVNWRGTVYHGLPEQLFHPVENPTGGYVVFLGRVSPEKGLADAIEIATKAGMRIQIAAKVDTVDRRYFNKRIVPLLDQPLVDFIGEVNDVQKQELLGNARALLFPINWPEPFGLVMIEALACGTPVIAFPNGSVPEILEDRRTGFIVNSVDEAVEALGRLPSISRAECREVFRSRFTARGMATEYVAQYENLAMKHS
jgi:glycosyltransferase involved in cell wall biosynthesis